MGIFYRAVDKYGNTIDFYLSRTRNANAAKLFLGKALKSIPEWSSTIQGIYSKIIQ